jgi:Na+/phosphate symporter
MEEKEYTQAICEILDSVGPILEDTRRCIFTDDKRCLEEAQKMRIASLRSCLPLAEELTGKKERSMLEQKFLTVLPYLQMLGIEIGDLLGASTIKIDSSIPFTDKALKEIKDVILGTEGLARDTKDFLLTKNPHLSQRIQSDLSKLYKMADDFSAEHQDRLIKGLCSPKASYIYLQMMESLKRTMRQLASLSEKA